MNQCNQWIEYNLFKNGSRAIKYSSSKNNNFTLSLHHIKINLKSIIDIYVKFDTIKQFFFKIEEILLTLD